VTGTDLTAHVAAARALRDDFERAGNASLRGGGQQDWQNWALRMSSVLGTVLGLFSAPVPGTVTLPDGSAFLSPADAATARAALGDAADFTTPENAARYAELAASIGGDQ
jgi:hypothetical protein